MSTARFLDKAGHVLVVQPLPGIGDMIWHLAPIRAIAAAAGGPVSLLAKPRSAADQLFAAEATLRGVLWLDRNPDRGRGRHDGPAGFLRLVAMLRAARIDTAVLLHHSRMIAMALALARIPARYGYGYPDQRRFLNRGPFLPAATEALHPYAQWGAWLAAAGLDGWEASPRLAIAAAARAAVAARLGSAPYLVFGIGTSEPYKQWGAARFAALAEALLEAGWGRIVLTGGAAEAALAAEIRAALPAMAACGIAEAIGWSLGEVAALCAGAGFYVGNDTGVMNIAAAAGAESFVLFGASEAIAHSARMIAVLPEGGAPAREGGMARITPAAVLAAIAARRGRIGV
ncbi:MAG: hypothetical protein KGL12_03555 [Rhodospirillales bacterium]|nr:hypothetical protein [Rhodospirillales bacterium]